MAKVNETAKATVKAKAKEKGPWETTMETLSYMGVNVGIYVQGGARKLTVRSDSEEMTKAARIYLEDKGIELL